MEQARDNGACCLEQNPEYWSCLVRPDDQGLGHDKHIKTCHPP